MGRARGATVWPRTLTPAPDARQSGIGQSVLSQPDSDLSASKEAAKPFPPPARHRAEPGFRDHGEDRDGEVIRGSPFVGRVDKEPGRITAALVTRDEFDLRVTKHVVKAVAAQQQPVAPNQGHGNSVD